MDWLLAAEALRNPDAPEIRVADPVAEVAYLVASILILLGLKGVASPRAVLSGNLLAALGILIAVVTTLLRHEILEVNYVLGGLAVGAIAGLLLAYSGRTTGLPPTAALFNALGGLAAMAVAGAAMAEEPRATYPFSISVAAAGACGAVSFWASVVAATKLRLPDEVRKPSAFPGHWAIATLLLLATIALAAYFVYTSKTTHVSQYAYWFGAVLLSASLLGVMIALPVGKGSIGIVVALMSALVGLAAAAVGFALDSSILMIAGGLAAGAGVALSRAICDEVIAHAKRA